MKALLLVFLLYSVVLSDEWPGGFEVKYFSDKSCSTQTKYTFQQHGCHPQDGDYIFYGMEIATKHMVVRYGCMSDDCTGCRHVSRYTFDVCDTQNITVKTNWTNWPLTPEPKPFTYYYNYVFDHDETCTDLRKGLSVIEVVDPVCSFESTKSAYFQEFCDDNQDLAKWWYDNEKCNGEPTQKETVTDTCTKQGVFAVIKKCN